MCVFAAQQALSLIAVWALFLVLLFVFRCRGNMVSAQQALSRSSCVVFVLLPWKCTSYVFSAQQPVDQVLVRDDAVRNKGRQGLHVRQRNEERGRAGAGPSHRHRKARADLHQGTFVRSQHMLPCFFCTPSSRRVCSPVLPCFCVHRRQGAFCSPVLLCFGVHLH